MMKVGFIGLGNMGGPMARNLLAAGFPLTVHNRSPAKAEALAALGASVAGSPAEVARASDVVLACLPTVRDVDDVFLNAEGLLAGSRPGQVLADHSTVDIATTRRIAEVARARGGAFLDAPISGGPKGAEDGSLAIMVGGDAEAYAKALPVFQAMGKTVAHLGPSGAGTAAKLANQLLVATGTIAICEAFLLAARAGVDLEKLHGVLESSWGASRMLGRNAPFILRREFGPSPAPVRNLAKDTAIIAALAREHGLDLPLAAAAERVYSELASRGHGEWDITAVLPFLEGGGG
jgi:3-hydroxyisobutyrate dehydrogenase-like beta-hydroxyacid dehydrogenase